MAFKNEEWKYSDVTDAPAPVAEGRRFLKIADCYYKEDDDKYTVVMEDLSDNARFSLSYWLTDTRDGKHEPNMGARSTLLSLGAALNGTPCGIPNPDSVVGGVVVGEIKKGTAGYRRCFKFYPAPESMTVFADIEQYSVPDESEVAE